MNDEKRKERELREMEKLGVIHGTYIAERMMDELTKEERDLWVERIKEWQKKKKEERE